MRPIYLILALLLTGCDLDAALDNSDPEEDMEPTAGGDYSCGGSAPIINYD